METNYETGTSQVEAGPLGSVTAYNSVGPRAKRVVGWFVAGIILAIVTIACNFHLYQMMGPLRHGEAVRETLLAANDRWQLLLAEAFLLWYFVMIIAFLMWKHRAHRNLPSLGAAGLEFSPRGAVG